jgi:hypothetical protein
MVDIIAVGPRDATVAWLQNAYPHLAALGLGHGPLLVCTDSQANRVIQPRVRVSACACGE